MTGIQALARGCCGCGSPETYYEAARDLLVHFSTQDRPWDWIYSDRFRYFAANALDHLGLIEHGTSLAGSWVTQSGQEALAFLQEHGVNPDEWPSGSVE